MRQFCKVREDIMKIFVRDFEYVFESNELLYEYECPYVDCTKLLDLYRVIDKVKDYCNDVIINVTLDNDSNQALNLFDERYLT